MAFPPALNLATGDAITEAVLDAYDTDVNAALRDTTSGGGAGSSQTPAVTTAEVRDARDGEVSLTAKLTAMESIFTGVGPSAIRNGWVFGNLLANDTFMMWSRGNAAAPDYWALNGTGATISRETGIPAQDAYAARITYGSTPAYLEQRVISSAMAVRMAALASNKYPPIIGGTSNARRDDYDADIDGQMNAYAIGHVLCGGSNRARVAITSDGADTFSPYHPGDGAWYSLIAGPATSVATSLAMRCRVEAAGSADFLCCGTFLTPLALPPMWLPGKVRYRELSYYANNPATGVLTYFAFSRPVFILGAQMQCLTAGTVTAPTIDLLTPIAGVYSSLFVTRPTIATGQRVGAAQECDPASADYRRRTIRPALAASATQLDNTSLRLDYADDGGGTLRDLIVTIHLLEYDRPLDQFRSMTDLGE